MQKLTQAAERQRERETKIINSENDRKESDTADSGNVTIKEVLPPKFEIIISFEANQDDPEIAKELTCKFEQIDTISKNTDQKNRS
ncbi:MAG: hypothetical protein LBC74_10600 [Planctomycetaceae bacterium]|jgi:hypothetical protein|nr:hypothetical protein [Planctomycetaceae bacterium]